MDDDGNHHRHMHQKQQQQHRKKKVVVIAGYGPSIGYATACKFGVSSSSSQIVVALLGRTQSRLEEGVQRLSSAKGIEAKAYTVDCGNAHAIRRTVHDIRSTVGSIEVIVWNAASYAGPNLLATEHGDKDYDDSLTHVLHEIMDVSAVGLLAMVQASLPDLKSNHGSVLVTGGGLSRYDDSVNQVTVNHSWDGLGLSKSIQRKLSGILNARLKKDKVFVGTVVISGPVRTGAGDGDDDSTDPNDVANAYWEMHQKQSQAEIHLGSLEPMINNTALQKTDTTS